MFNLIFTYSIVGYSVSSMLTLSHSRPSATNTTRLSLAPARLNSVVQCNSAFHSSVTSLTIWSSTQSLTQCQPQAGSLVTSQLTPLTSAQPILPSANRRLTTLVLVFILVTPTNTFAPTVMPLIAQLPLAPTSFATANTPASVCLRT